MFNFLAYPVSGIMKLWHVVLHSLCGMDEHRAWFFAIVGLVITVRGLLVPFFWYQYKSGRSLALMLPVKHALEEQVKRRMDPRAAYVQRAATKQLHKQYRYRPGIGCIPPLIQIPAFLGLYRLILLMARPPEGITAEHPPIGFLNSEDVSSFLEASISGVPLPAYRVMDPQLLATLGTTQDEVASFTLPILVLAVSFTTLNTVLSIYRSLQQFNYDSTFTVVMNRILIGTLIVLPAMLIALGWLGALPVAVIIYWFANNLWTLSQQAVLYLALSVKYPLTEEFKKFRRARRIAFKERTAQTRRQNWRRRGLRVRRIVTPWREDVAHELREENEKRRTEKLQEKKRKKALSQVKAIGYQLEKRQVEQAKEQRSAQHAKPKPRSSDRRRTPGPDRGPRHLSRRPGTYRSHYRPKHQLHQAGPHHRDRHKG